MRIYIVTVCRNAQLALAATLDSVNEFRTPDVSYLVVDGNSSDGTRELILSRPQNGIDRWVSEADSGIYDAMNKAVALLPEEDGHVLFLGAGDRLLRLPSAAQRTAGTVLYGDVQVGDRLFASAVGWRLKAGNTLHHQGLFVPRELFRTMAFDPAYGVYADFDFNQRLLRSGRRFAPLHMTIAYAEPGGLSWGASNLEMVQIARKNFGPLWGTASKLWADYRAVRRRLQHRSW